VTDRGVRLAGGGGCRPPAVGWRRCAPAAACVALVLALVPGAGCDSSGGDPPAADCQPAPPRPAGLVIAGSGSNVAPVRVIAKRYRRARAVEVRVPESIGTGGALRALADGAIDVGLASRPLSAPERAAGLVESPLARIPVAAVVHPEVSVSGLTLAELTAIYRGERDRWPDGTPIVPLLREPGDSGNALIARAWPALWAAMDAASREGRFTTCYTDQEMADTLAGTNGAIGFLDIGTLRIMRPRLRPLAIDGVPPTPLRAEAGSYPLVKTLTFVTVGPPAGAAEGFVHFATSPETREILAGWGYMPPGGR
jgi:phosphate transport system substrate-binding protein